MPWSAGPARIPALKCTVRYPKISFTLSSRRFSIGLLSCWKVSLSLLIEFLLLLRQLGRNDDVGGHIEIAASRPPLLVIPRLRTRKTIPDCVPEGIRSRSSSPSSVGIAISAPSAACGNEIGNVTIKIVFAALEELMLLYREHHIEIAGRTAVAGSFTFSADAELVAGIDAGRNLHFEVTLA